MTSCDRIRGTSQHSCKILARGLVKSGKSPSNDARNALVQGSMMFSELKKEPEEPKIFPVATSLLMYVSILAASHFVSHGGLGSRQLAVHCAAGSHGVETCRLGRKAVSISHDGSRENPDPRARLWAALQGRDNSADQ